MHSSFWALYKWQLSSFISISLQCCLHLEFRTEWQLAWLSWSLSPLKALSGKSGWLSCTYPVPSWESLRGGGSPSKPQCLYQIQKRCVLIGYFYLIFFLRTWVFTSCVDCLKWASLPTDIGLDVQGIDNGGFVSFLSLQGLEAWSYWSSRKQVREDWRKSVARVFLHLEVSSLLNYANRYIWATLS